MMRRQMHEFTEFFGRLESKIFPGRVTPAKTILLYLTKLV